ncbi:hypothetical protein BDN72DRAFT_907348 [Pluteus cervinus]|uniref:Uncharacterized protein n=1 Tax=Pluteus cervinus TaxID=181527 RepID=A0ACD2ZWP0_9AGAR|nr:hypothetical protein BDN72DRAFT_907348 [Pluteus cervinus]
MDSKPVRRGTRPRNPSRKVLGNDNDLEASYGTRPPEAVPVQKGRKKRSRRFSDDGQLPTASPPNEGPQPTAMPRPKPRMKKRPRTASQTPTQTISNQSQQVIDNEDEEPIDDAEAQTNSSTQQVLDEEDNHFILHGRQPTMDRHTQQHQTQVQQPAARSPTPLREPSTT